MTQGNDVHAIRYVECGWNGLQVRLEYRWVGCAQSDDPVVVFLHEGLGSISLWRDFPQRFCSDNGFRGIVFSRYGYGRSTPRPPGGPLPLSYLHEQAHDALPAFLHALGIERPWLFGHSDGASIALLHAARYPDDVSGIVAMAPHIFVEDITLEGIRAAREAYRATDLRARLARHHADADPDAVFSNWCDTWLAPSFRAWNIEAELAQIRCPALLIQGEGDEYGSLRQIDGIQEKVPQAQMLVLADCGHSPHRDQPRLVAQRAAAFIRAASGAADAGGN
jgi:pimeloyl-ACP methyl ester carboxylesterase